MFLVLCASCGQDTAIFPSTSLEEKGPAFFEKRRKRDQDRKKILEQSHKIYQGGELCADKPSCIKICEQIFVSDGEKKDCSQLYSPQVYRFEKIHSHLLEKDKSSLKKIESF